MLALELANPETFDPIWFRPHHPQSAQRLHLKPDSAPPPDKAATARLQHILNDFAKADNKPRIFGEYRSFRSKTKEHVIKFQQKHNIFPGVGIVGPKTWKALLERWAALRPLPLA